MNLERVDPETVDQYLEDASLKTTGDIDARVKRLNEHFAAKGEEMASCDNCGGTSPPSLPTCPFCGQGDESTTPEEKASEPAIVQTSSGKLKGGKKKKTKDAPAATALATVVEGSALATDFVPAPELDKHVERIAVLKRQGNAVTWQLGNELYAVYKDKLWERRLNPSGARVYRSWVEWCLSSELQMDPSNAMKLAEVAAKFSESQVTEYGYSKLSLVVRLPDTQQPKGLQMADELPFRALKEEIKKMGSQPGERTSVNPKKAGKKLSAVKPEAPKVTAVMLVGKSKYPLLARPTKQGEAPRPAKGLKDMPWCTIKLANDVEMRALIVQDPRGELILHLDVNKLKKEPVEPKQSKAKRVAALAKPHGGARKGAGKKTTAKKSAPKKTAKKPAKKPSAKKAKKK